MKYTTAIIYHWYKLWHWKCGKSDLTLYCCLLKITQHNNIVTLMTWMYCKIQLLTTIRKSLFDSFEKKKGKTPHYHTYLTCPTQHTHAPTHPTHTQTKRHCLLLLLPTSSISYYKLHLTLSTEDSIPVLYIKSLHNTKDSITPKVLSTEDSRDEQITIYSIV